MTSLQNPHGPLQIIDFVENPDPSNKNRMLHLNEDVLSTVFQAAGERRIAIISIAGPSRKGKSFFLDFLIRYLEAFEKDDSDWMDWDDKNKPLEGFSWRTSIERETSGIVIWSKPFIIKANGKEIAVLLMDTQGTYDEYTTEREMSAIVGLTLLSSSCLIFNFFNGIQEDVFNSLDTYIKYGQLALGGDDDDMEVDQDKVTPFQKLVFLIRDWNMPTEFPYGSKGGKAYLAEKLKIKDKLTEMGEHVRNRCASVFLSWIAASFPVWGRKPHKKGLTDPWPNFLPTFAKNWKR
ncbi:atlastin-1-like isoform X2 [Folsomia candida]|uniref:atlastin-1-like isoform X2 n=1 Tax=Folsomia candida TaxID=158441 RepID=UPI001604D86A|nr:atlastin-1-like isoform X2 [Folsomia candida]